MAGYMVYWGKDYVKELEKAKRSGYVRVRVDGSIYDLSEEIKLDKNIDA